MKSIHDQKVEQIIAQLKKRNSTVPVSLRKKGVSHQVPKTGIKRYPDEKIDIGNLNEILHIDPDQRICVAEPGVTFVDLVKATLKYGLVPYTVPELKTITIGGAVAGCSIESMSYKHGGFHDSCLEYEIITARGEVLACTPGNGNGLIFEMIHGTFGTLGIISKLTFKLRPAKQFVKVRYEKYADRSSYQASIWRHFKNEDVDFMDGMIHSPREYVLSTADFTDHAPYAHKYDWTRIYYQSTAQRKEDYLRTADYFFRYDQGLTYVTPKSFLGRLLFGKLTNSTRVLKVANRFQRFLPRSAIPFTLDTFIPFTKSGDFLDWYGEEVDHFPLWCVPYKARHYKWIAEDYVDVAKEPLFLDIAIYGMRRNDGRNYYKLILEELMNIGGLQTLISSNYFTEADFWKIWNRENYYQVKQVTDPDNIFRDLYTKTCSTMHGQA